MPAIINHNLPLLDKKEWQMMTPAPVSTTAAMFVVEDGSSLNNYAFYCTSATVHYLYSHNEDAWVQIPSGALAGTFGAGSCGTYSPWSVTYTATGGSTSTIQVAAASFNLTAVVINQTVEFLSSGTNTGLRRVITSIDSGGGSGTITLNLDYPVSTAVLNTHTFRVTSGRFFVMNAGTIAAGIFKCFDVGTMTWQASLATTGLPATWATDGKLVWTGRKPSVYANGAATSGSTTTLVDTSQNWATNQWAGLTALLVSGTGAGQVASILSNTATTLTFSAALSVAPAAATVYQLRAQPATAIGVATSGSATTIVNSAKSWTTNQWTNFQVRIVSGTGQGQIRKITSNTGTTLTIPSGATIDNTSVYQIEPNEDSIYLLGNNAVTMYLYSISGNTWSTVAPTTARGGAPGTGMNADFVDITGDAIWGTENGIQDSRYIYSHRGAAGSLIDRFDITGGTAGAGAWAAITYSTGETFTTGSSGFQQGRFFYMRKDATNRLFKYDIPGNALLPFNTDMYPDGAALLGQKIWIKYLDASGTIQWLYSLANTGTALRRIGIV